MSKTLKEICDAVGIRSGLGKQQAYFGANDETLAFLANESVEFILRKHNWQKLRKTATIPMTTATTYSLPSDMKYYVADTMNADGQERFIQFPTPDDVWWYFKSHSPTGIRYKVRLTNDQLEVLNPDSGIDLLFEYIGYPITSNRAASADKEEFTSDNDVWNLDNELLILDMKWRYLKIKGIEGWQEEAKVAENHLRTLIGQEDGATSLNFGGKSEWINHEPYTDLYV